MDGAGTLARCRLGILDRSVCGCVYEPRPEEQAVKVAVVIPTFDEGPRLDVFLQRLVEWQATSKIPWSLSVVVVDDGSPEPIHLNDLSASNIDFYLLRHRVNLGQGAALQTGISYARLHLNSDVFVTMDGDGQHDPNDIPVMITKLVDDHLDIVFGNRFSAIDHSKVPTMRKVLLKAAIWFERLITGVRVTDAHNGFRCFNRRCADAIQLRQNRMAHATEFKQIVARHKLRYGEAPIHVTYTQDSLRKGQSNVDGIVIVKDLLRVYLFNSSD